MERADQRGRSPEPEDSEGASAGDCNTDKLTENAPRLLRGRGAFFTKRTAPLAPRTTPLGRRRAAFLRLKNLIGQFSESKISAKNPICSGFSRILR